MTNHNTQGLPPEQPPEQSPAQPPERPTKTLTYVQREDIWTYPGPTIGYVCVVDVGTTGPHPEFDQFTNVAWMVLGVNANYQVSEVKGPWRYDCRHAMIEDEEGLPQEVNQFLNHLSRCRLVVAHNAKFDFTVLDRALPVLPSQDQLPWACSLRDINWRSLGLFDHRLKDVLEFGGMCHHAHDSIEDVIGLSWVLSQNVPYAAPIAQSPEITLQQEDSFGQLEVFQGIPPTYPTFLHRLISWVEAPKVKFTLTRELSFTAAHDLKRRGYQRHYRHPGEIGSDTPQWFKWVHIDDAETEFSEFIYGLQEDLTMEAVFAHALFDNMNSETPGNPYPETRYHQLPCSSTPH